MTARNLGPPGKDPAAVASGGRDAERLGGGSGVSTLPRPADEFRDLAGDLVAEMVALYDRAGYCECDDDHCNFGEVSQGLVDLAEDARRRLWLAELDGGRRG